MKIVIACAFILLAAKCYSQQVTYKELIGKWDLREEPSEIRVKIVLDFKDSSQLISSDIFGIDTLAYAVENSPAGYRLHLIKKDSLNKIKDNYHLIELIDGGVLKIQPPLENSREIKFEDAVTFNTIQILIKRK